MTDDLLDADEVRLVVQGRQAWMHVPGHGAAWIRANEEALWAPSEAK